jgi:hypothetical protein
MYVLDEDIYRLEYYEFQIVHLEKKRMKIVQRGPLSEYEDLTLYIIDDNIKFWTGKIKSLYSKLSQSS